MMVLHQRNQRYEENIFIYMCSISHYFQKAKTIDFSSKRNNEDMKLIIYMRLLLL